MSFVAGDLIQGLTRLGIDGEIELCVERTDGDGRVGTGKIVKVQSKSGSSYVTKNTATSFEMPTRRSDLEYWTKVNVPVICACISSIIA